MGRPVAGEPNDIEFVDDGERPAGADRGADYRCRTWSGGPKWIALLLAVLVGTLVVTTIKQHNRNQSSAVMHLSTDARSSAASTIRRSASSVVESRSGPRLLGGVAKWELFGRGNGSVVRVQFATGQITETRVPVAAADGPDSMVVGAHSVLIRPVDGEPGYLIRDGKAPGRLPTPDFIGPAFPGPNGNDVWFPSFARSRPRVTLTGLDGRRIGSSIPIPAGSSFRQAASDGSGYVMFAGVSGTFDVRPSGSRRITTGTVLAVGPTRWLTRECDDHDRCSTVVVDHAHWRRHVINSIASDGTSAPMGVVSPDGRTAAMIDLTDETEDVHLRNLTTGADHRLALPTDLATALGDGSLVWSPDSRWLFVAAAHGHVAVVDAATRTVRSLGLPLPSIDQLAIRRAPRR